MSTIEIASQDSSPLDDSPDELSRVSTLPGLYEYPHERGSDVALHIAVAMERLPEENRTRPLVDILNEDHPYTGVGETTYAAILAVAAELGTFTPQSHESPT
jgi:hypothetical protein